MEFDTDRVVIVGGVPEPVGGVTTYIYRLARAEKAIVSTVVDLYAGRKKKDISPVDHLCIAGRLFLLPLFLLKNKDDIYFNFSGVRALLFIFFMPKRKNVRWFLTLHNGNFAASFDDSGIVLRCLFLLSLGRMSRVGYLSLSQREAYENMGLNGDKLIRVSSFVPVDPLDITPVSSDQHPELASMLQCTVPYFVISGYPTSIYKHLEVFEVFEELWQSNISVKLIACLYGEDSENLLAQIKKRFSESSDAFLLWGADSEDFLSILRGAAGYLRMNTVDSYGVAVAEAVSLGVPCIATNVCERYPGAILTAPNEYSDLKRFVLNIAS